MQWNFYTVPMKKGDPGLDTWKNLDAARHGGGQIWIPGVYDPETHLYIFGTGNPTPAYTSGTARRGRQPLHLLDRRDQRRYRQDGSGTTRPRRTTRTTGTRRRRRCWSTASSAAAPRKMVLHASRNGYFFTLDRLTGEHLVTGTVLRHGELGEGR